MGNLTRGEIREELRASLGNRQDVTDARLNRMILLAEQRIEDEFPWHELSKESTVPGQFKVNLAAEAYNFLFPVGGEAFGGRSAFTSAAVAPGIGIFPSSNDWGVNHIGKFVYIQNPRVVGGTTYGPLEFAKITNATALAFILSDPAPVAGADLGQGIYSYVPVRDIFYMEYHSDLTFKDPVPLTYVSPGKWKESTAVPIDPTSGLQASRTPFLYTWEYVDFPKINFSGDLYPAVFKLWPQPDRDFYIRAHYTKRVSVMTDDDDYSELLTKDYAIIAMAAHYAFRSLGRPEDAAGHFAVYTDIIDKAKMREPRRYDHIPDVRPGPRGRYWADPFVRRSP